MRELENEISKLIIKQDSFRRLKIIGGFLLLFLGFKFFIHTVWVGLLIWLFAIYVFLSYSGLEFDSELLKYRNFITHFGFKTGRWKRYSKYKGIIIRTVKYRKSVGGPNLVQIGTAVKVYYVVFLVDETHRKQLEIKSFKKLEKARGLREELSQKLGLPIQKYNPIVSKATKKRRYHGPSRLP